ncbi:unnamed protein product [Boreogadus saida]
MADTPLCSLYNLCSFFTTIVKLPEPVKMAALWSDHKLKLTWPSQGDSASAEVLVRHVENKTQTWSHEKKIETANNVYSVLLEDLETQRAYQVQVRQRSTQVTASLWSDWSANLTVPAEFHRENLQPDSRYNVTLAGATSVGPGPRALLSTATFRSVKPPEGNLPVWISLGLLVAFFGASILCSLLVKRFKTMILPPVPEPVILFSALIRADNQELERRETLDEVSVNQPVLGGEHHWFEDLEEDMDDGNTLKGTDEDHVLRSPSGGQGWRGYK